MNRFQNCKTLLDLQNVFEQEAVTFETLASDEQEKIVSVFYVQTTEEVELPLTPVRYEYIRDEVYAAAAAVQAADESAAAQEDMMGNFENFEEDETMENKKNVFDAATQKLTDAAKTVKVQAGMDVEEFKEVSDGAINTIKAEMFKVLGVLDDITGATVLKDSLMRILYKNAERGSQRGFFDAAAECRRVVRQHINAVMAFDPDENELKEVAALRYMLGEDEEGKPTGKRSVFSAFANSIVWICRKVSRKFRAWFGTDASHNVFGTVGAALASVFGMAAGIIGSALKLAMHAVVFAGSYAVAAVIKAVSFVWNQLKKLGSFIKSKFDKQDEVQDIVEDTQEEMADEEAPEC